MALHRELEQYHTNEFTITASAPMAGPNCSYRPMTQHSRRSSATQSTDLFGVATQSASKPCQEVQVRLRSTHPVQLAENTL